MFGRAVPGTGPYTWKQRLRITRSLVSEVRHVSAARPNRDSIGTSAELTHEFRDLASVDPDRGSFSANST